MKVLVCLSGGIDSATVLAMMKEQRHQCEVLLFDYAQHHIIELEYARELADGLVIHKVELAPMPLVDDVVFAGRNLVLASHAISIAASHKMDAVAFGCNQSDWARFPDCRPLFWRAVGYAASEAYGIRVLLPLLRMIKAEVVAEARRLAVPLDRTWSCYHPRGGKPCGECLACRVRRDAGA
jgi:7-cyano-7-deazaguanine synthase